MLYIYIRAQSFLIEFLVIMIDKKYHSRVKFTSIPQGVILRKKERNKFA